MESSVIRLIVDGLQIECLVALRNAFVAEEPTGAREGIPRAKRAALAGASGVCKRTQTAGEIPLDITDFGEGLVWLFALDLKGR